MGCGRLYAGHTLTLLVAGCLTSPTLQLLKKMDSNTSASIIQLLSSTESFTAFAKIEGDNIMKRVRNVYYWV
jgi:hypothetical protein